jgi:hypothetical protein
MSSRTNIDPLSITDGKISNQAKISPKKIAPADEASLLIAQGDRKYQPKTIYGDGTIDADGKLTITSTPAPTTTIVEEELLPEDSVRIGPSSTDNTKKNSTKKVGSGAGAIPTRDSSGNLKAETADQATNATNATNADNATLLNGNNMEYYRNVANHVAETATTSTDNNNNDISHQKTPHKVFEFEVPTDSGSYSAAGTGPSNYPIEFTHNCGYIPDISVYYKSNNAQASDPWEEVDAEVQNTTTTTKVQISAQNAHLKIVAK